MKVKCCLGDWLMCIQLMEEKQKIATTIMYKYNSTMDLTQSTNLIYINHITILTWGTPKPLDIPSSKENQE